MTGGSFDCSWLRIVEPQDERTSLACSVITAEIAIGQIHSTAQLHRALEEQLRFPHYYGGNWSALSDCLTDLRWIQEDTVELVVLDSEQLFERAWGPTFIEVLRESGRELRCPTEIVNEGYEAPAHRLVVTLVARDSAEVRNQLRGLVSLPDFL